MKTSISNKLIIGFTLATAFLLFFAIITFINMQKVKSDSKKQFESYIILKNIEDLYVSVLEIESDSRGYAITGKKSFLDNYENAIKQINIKLRELISENNNQRIKNSELLKIKQHIAEKLEFCNKIISLRDDYGVEESLALVSTEKGKILIYKIRTAIRSIEENERLYLYASNNLQIKSADFTILIFTILLLIITVILSLVYYYFNTDQSEKKYSELALKEAKDQLQAILDNNNSLVFIKNLEGKFIFVNKPFERKVKLTSQFILGSTDYDFYPKEDADKFWESDNETIIKKTLVEFDGMIMEKEGPTYYNTIKFPLYDNTGKMYGICGITNDVTKRRKIEADLKDASNQLQAILDNTNSLVAIRDKNGIFLFVNKEYEKLFHLKSGDLLGKSVFDIFPKETADQIYQHDMEVVKNQKLKEYEIDFPVDDEVHSAITAKFPLYDADNKIYGICAVSTDITERRKAEEELRKTSFFQQAILSGTDYAIIATDLQGKIIEFNKGAEEMLGYKAIELINRQTPYVFLNESELTAKSSLENNISPYNVLVADAELDKPVTKESSYIHKNRSLIPVLLSVSALRNAIGEITGYLGIARNISEQKIAEQQLKDSQHLFQNMAANVPGMIFQYYVKPDNTTGFLFVSNACKDIFEVNPEDIVSGKYRLLDFLLPEEREPYFNAILNSAKTLNKLTYEAAISTHSKTIKWLKVTAQPEKLNDGTIIFNGVLIDISDRKAAEVDLKKSQERYEIAVQGANDGLWDWDLISNKVYFSSRWKSMLGYQEHEIENNLDAFTKLLHPDQVAGVFERVNEYIAGNVKNYEIEFQLLHKKGYYHWILARGAVLRNQNGKAYRFAGSHTDIMERKIQEEALLSSEARFRAMNDASPLGIFVTNPTGDCIYTNSAYQKITGFEATALLGDGWITAIHPDDKEMVAKKWYECTESNQTFESIHRFVKPDNTVVWTSVKAAEMRDDKKIIGYVGTVDDLTETKKAENEILQSTYMINNATDAIIGSDINFVITSFNSAAEKIYGFKKEEVIGKVAENILITEFISTTKRNFLIALKHQGVWSGEVLQTRKDEKIIPVLSSLSINKDNEGNVIGYLAVNRDISERKKREDIISKLNIELEQNLNQLELSNRELEAFSYSISHDLRAPLRAIDGFTQILKEDYIEKMDDEAQRLMNVIMNNAKKMGQLIDDLLDFSRLSKKEIIKVSIDMNQMVAIVLEDLKSNFHDLHPEIKINSLPAALGDSSTLKQVWVNLISNAIKYSQNQKKSKIEIGFTEKENEIIYFVKDNGVGFNMKYYDKLFGVFQRLHSAEEFEGTGVGLAIVQRIILKNGGRVWADAEVNKGATFFFSLPK